MKMSEFTTKSFLGNAGAAENSYILINYEDNTTQRPVTYKASLLEIGKAIANDLKLYKKTQNGAITTNVSQGAYVNTAAENFATVGYVNTKTDGVITSSNISLYTNGLASTGYVASAINTAKNNLASVGYVENRFYGIASEGYVTSAVSGLASENYVTEALEEAGGFSPLESVTCSVIMEPSASEASTLSVYPIMGDRNGNIFSIYGDSSTELQIRDDIATTTKITSAINNVEERIMDYSGEGVGGWLYNEYHTDGLASTGYVTSAINTATSGLASTGALSTKASIGYVKYCGRKIFELNNKYVIKNHPDASDPIELTTAMLITDCSISHTKYFPIGAYIDPNDNDATLYRYNPTAREMQALLLNENNISNAISGLASTGYVTNAVSGLASTGYVTAAVANAGGSFDPTELVTCDVFADPEESDSQSWSLRPVMMANSTSQLFEYSPVDKGYFPIAFASAGDITDAVNTATSGLASTGYVNTALNNVLYYTTDTSHNIWLEDKEGNSLLVFRYSQLNHEYTIEAPN